MDQQDSLTVAVPMFVEVLNQSEVDADNAETVSAELGDGLAAASVGDLHLKFALRFGSTRDSGDLTGSLLIRGPQRPGETQIHKLLMQAARDLVLGTHSKANEAFRAMAKAQEDLAAAHESVSATNDAMEKLQADHAATLQANKVATDEHIAGLNGQLEEYRMAERARAAELDAAQPEAPEATETPDAGTP